MKRSQIPEKYKWNLKEYCSNDKDFYARTALLEDKVKKFKEFEGKLDDENLLFQVLNFDSEVSYELDILGNYAMRRLDENLASSEGQELESEFSKVATIYSVATSFIVPEISGFSDEKLKKLQNNEKFFRFKLFFKDIIKSKPHILKQNEEKMLSGMSEFLGGFSDCFDAFSDADLKFEDICDSKGKKYILNQELYGKYMRSDDRVLRKNAITFLNGGFGKFINLLTKNYLSNVKEDCYFAKLRNYSSALDQAIETEDASKNVYQNLINSIRKNIQIMYRFANLKKGKLKLDDFAIYDQSAPVGKLSSKKYSFDEAFELLKNSTKVLGEKYGQILDLAKKERWIDVMPSEGKASGAYSAGAYRKPPVVLLNFVGDLRSVETLVHEMGHSMHSYFSSQKQIYEEAGYVIFVAEVASTVNETLLTFYLLENSKSKNEKLALIDNLFVNIRSTIFRQTMFAEFEEWVHSQHENGVPLSKDKLCKKYFDLNKYYFGSKTKLVKEIQYEWARIPHFYRSFYVYKYATGLISALNIVRRILAKEEGAVERYLNFLSAGGTKPPVELLKDAGCDLEDPKTFDDVFEFLNTLLDEYEKL